MAVLLEAPGVSRAVVVPEPRLSPTHVVAVVERSRGAAPSDLVQRCRSRLSGPRVPRRIVFVDRMPLTATGKVDRAAAAALIDDHGA